MRIWLLFCAVWVLAAADAPAQKLQPQTPRDGSRDFEWEFGEWHTHVRVLRNPLSGAAPNWAVYDGTSVVRPILGGRFNLVELSVAGPAGRIEGASLRLYDPQKRQWSLNYANARGGVLTAPVYGTFDDRGHGLFYAEDTLDGRAILVRFVISRLSPTQAHFEQAYSADGGVTWETNWLAEDKRPPRKSRSPNRGPVPPRR